MLNNIFKGKEINIQLKIMHNLHRINMTFNLIKNRFTVKLIYPF